MQIPIQVHVNQPACKINICWVGMDALSSRAFGYVPFSQRTVLSTWKLSENFDWYPKYLGPHNVQICKKKVYNLSPNLELCKRAVNTKVSTCSIRHVSSAMRAKLLEGHSAWEGADLTVLPPASATIAAAFRLGDRVPVAWSNLTHTL